VNEDLIIFVRAVLGADKLPSEVRHAASSLDFVSRSTFDQSYLDFLQEQIDGPNDTERTAQMKERLTALTSYRDTLTLVGFVPTLNGLWSIRVDPAKGKVIHGEIAP
jgi:hypothetical protein